MQPTEIAIYEVLRAKGMTGQPDLFAAKVEGVDLERVREITLAAAGLAYAAGRYIVWNSDFEAAMAEF